MGSVQGYVVTEEGKTVPDASVLIAEGPGPAPDIAAITDDTGRFVLDGFAEGTYLLRAFGPTGEIGETSVFVHGDGKADARIVLRPDGPGDSHRL